ncbi:hypothetical protein SKAU_G00374160 [Synaphobranchus kaupii]|uniref:Uncharacterized protein n=1 Tax=Synaphobranchus kaupii TaxID=118154 RepID=A0A9Q1EGP8_SYNKA|nr:hypothetical protein SKAU_G00374160 [Synaphobranchus kaupii]
MEVQHCNMYTIVSRTQSLQYALLSGPGAFFQPQAPSSLEKHNACKAGGSSASSSKAIGLSPSAWVALRSRRNAKVP